MLLHHSFNLIMVIKLIHKLPYFSNPTWSGSRRGGCGRRCLGLLFILIGLLDRKGARAVCSGPEPDSSVIWPLRPAYGTPQMPDWRIEKSELRPDSGIQTQCSAGIRSASGTMRSDSSAICSNSGGIRSDPETILTQHAAIRQHAAIQEAIRIG